MNPADAAGPVTGSHTHPAPPVPAKPVNPVLVRWSKRLLPPALLAVAWLWLLQHADLSALAQALLRLPAWMWALAALALIGGHVLRAQRLRQEWIGLGDPGFLACLRLVTAHNAAVLLMPLRTGEAGYVWLVRRQWGVSWRPAAASLLRWRLQDATVLCVLSLLLLAPWPPLARALAALGFLTLAYPLLPRVWPFIARGLLARGAPSADSRDRAAPPGVEGVAPVQERSMPAAAQDELGKPWRGTLASAGTWSLKVLANGSLLAALAGLNLATAWRAALGGEWAGVQPLQPPAGLGTYEAGVWLAAQLPPPALSTVVAAALAVHAFSLLIALGSAWLCHLLIPAAPSCHVHPH